MKRAIGDDQLPLARNRPVDEDVRRELEFHLHERAREFEARGLTPEQALAAARESFGDRESVEAECRAIENRRRSAKHRADRLGALKGDVIVGLRVLRKQPGFTLSAMVTLALGIGANATVFSIVDQVILRPLPYANADRLVTIEERHANNTRSSMPWSNFLDLDAQSTAFSGMASFGAGLSTVLGAGAPLRVKTAQVSAGFFKVFPQRPVLGRLPLPEEHRLGAPVVAVVSYAFWRDHLGSPASLDGVHLKLDNDATVIGVLPAGFDYPEGSQVWTALEIEPQSTSRTAHNWDAVGRLRRGIEATAGERDLTAILARLKPMYEPDFDASGAAVTPLQDALTGSFRTPLFLLFAASGVLLLAACTNLASAMLARGTARAGEFAVRSALGATRIRLIRQLVTESLILAVLGCVAGLALASLLLRAVVAIAPSQLPLDQLHVDTRVQLFAAVMTLGTTALFGLVPALRLSEAGSLTSLREGSRGTAGVRRMRAWDVLVAAEVALAVLLMSGSVLLIRSFSRVMDNQLGFDPAQVQIVSVELPNLNYDGASPAVSAFHDRLLERLRRQPGIDAVGFANRLPLAGANPSGVLVVDGKPLNSRGPFNGFAIYRVVGGAYFDALRIPLIKGRTFRPDGGNVTVPEVVVDEAFANDQWPGRDPIGQRVRVFGMDRGDEPWYTVIGVVGNVRSSDLTGKFRGTYYFDHHTRPGYRAQSASYAIRSRLEPAALTTLVRREISAVDPEVPASVRSMASLIAGSVADRSFTMQVLSAFALVALALAIAGIYAVVSYSVAQRTREIGVRIALGATAMGVRRLVVGSAMRAVVPGLLVGGLLAVADARVLRTLVYGISPFDVTTLLLAVGTLALAALGSSVLPAFRATRVDPLIAMRAE